MKKKRFPVEQITAVLHRAEQGSWSELCRKVRDLRAELLSVEAGLRRAAAERSAGAKTIAGREHEVGSSPTCHSARSCCQDVVHNRF